MQPHLYSKTVRHACFTPHSCLDILIHFLNQSCIFFPVPFFPSNISTILVSIFYHRPSLDLQIIYVFSVFLYTFLPFVSIWILGSLFLFPAWIQTDFWIPLLPVSVFHPMSFPIPSLCGQAVLKWLAVGHSSSGFRVRALARAGHFSTLLPLSGLRSPTCCHNTILVGTATLYERGASAGSMSLRRNKASLKSLTRATNGRRLTI